MLVLSRKKLEELVLVVPGIEKPLVVSIQDVRGDKVRLGIVAPREVQIHRREVFDAIQASQKQPAG